MDRIVYRALATSALVSAVGFAAMHWIDTRLTAWANLTDSTP